MATDTQKLGAGLAALVVGSVLILSTSFVNTPVPGAAAGVAAMLMAVGSLLVGLSEKGAGV
ncbi:uncharacterized protein NP_0350A [Natronomonas pharaonis DSM 2160]|uniref:Uncharacterized protein n=1 Tax=Natronomonas pharaonis (strain ATCC 35678 / DSM 2160 / CIP 103997 / JCM 8858 / NBRC 14720 / NCIMB 2260 / Gabara) TaxID=348780 RepID=A0A1U7ETM3_NATPD|nr:hypothetical protein [Natronomonas pharaonis]CAI48266.1 uncharacterized protein NP_0350A [Natronomonas pharaonis DSM 2160]